MDETVEELKKRVFNLQQLLSNVKNDESLTSQVKNTSLRLKIFLDQNPNLAILVEAAIKFNISQDEKVLESSSLNDRNVPSDIKEERISINYPMITKLFPQILELEQMQPMKIMNKINSNISNSNIEQTKYIFEQRKERIMQLNEAFNQLVLKNILIFEKYVQFVLRDNQFWIETEEKLKCASQKIQQLESRKKQLNHY
ncbi:uncharacterized protein KGF55_003335 [Candida pseudojiufengensis]|uniref:uncharacterized protein n=1 Tax=Candida pseudojiufengensis TaxID=497109 RepID=UPI002225361D|nr:uncharacterized protein KGF55_003335 [Candida pseudojiufengensis]KAI5962259.1 hypothetical protein KGF55_003335 [Candida pseudojiufengensis]